MRSPRAARAVAVAGVVLGLAALALAAWVAVPWFDAADGRAPPACAQPDLGGAGADAEAVRAARARALDACLDAGHVDVALRHAYQLYRSYWTETRYREALEYAELALDQAERIDDRRWQQHVLMALFMILYDIGDLVAAEDVLRRAAALTDRDDAEKWAYVRSYDGLARKSRGELAGARTAFRDVLEAAPAGHPMRSDARFNLVEVCLDLGRVDEARAHLDAVVSGEDATASPSGTRRIAEHYYRAVVAHASGELAAAEAALRQAVTDGPLPDDWAWDVHHRLGAVLAAGGEHAGAAQAYERAITAVEALRASFAESELKEWLLAKKRAPYEGLFVLQVERGAIADALHTVERAKARAFLDAFIAATARRDGDRSARSAAAERAETLRALLPSLRGSPIAAPRAIADVLGDVAGREVLVYFWAESHLWLARVGAGPPVIRELALAEDDLADQVARFLADPDDDAVARSLGRALLPVDVLPEPGRTLHVVTDGVLGELPFAALRPGPRARYLVERHPIAYVPSLNALAALAGGQRERRRERDPERTDHPRGGRDAVIIGDPHGDLPGAAAEVAEVAALLGASSLRGEAVVADVLRRAAHAPVLHLATHAGRDARGAWLELADGKLHAAAVLDMDLAPRLVVLATCLSGSRPGTGMWGSLGGAFLAAGSEAVLATLWSVDDAAARRFVLQFYREGGADAPTVALARAQRALIAGGAKPSTWSPFVLFGTEMTPASAAHPR